MKKYVAIFTFCSLVSVSCTKLEESDFDPNGAFSLLRLLSLFENAAPLTTEITWRFSFLDGMGNPIPLSGYRLTSGPKGRLAAAAGSIQSRNQTLTGPGSIQSNIIDGNYGVAQSVHIAVGLYEFQITDGDGNVVSEFEVPILAGMDPSLIRDLLPKLLPGGISFQVINLVQFPYKPRTVLPEYTKFLGSQRDAVFMVSMLVDFSQNSNGTRRLEILGSRDGVNFKRFPISNAIASSTRAFGEGFFANNPNSLYGKTITFSEVMDTGNEYIILGTVAESEDRRSFLFSIDYGLNAMNSRIHGPRSFGGIQIETDYAAYTGNQLVYRESNSASQIELFRNSTFLRAGEVSAPLVSDFAYLGESAIIASSLTPFLDGILLIGTDPGDTGLKFYTGVSSSAANLQAGLLPGSSGQFVIGNGKAYWIEVDFAEPTRIRFYRASRSNFPRASGTLNYTAQSSFLDLARSNLAPENYRIFSMGGNEVFFNEYVNNYRLTFESFVSVNSGNFQKFDLRNQVGIPVYDQSDFDRTFKFVPYRGRLYLYDYSLYSQGGIIFYRSTSDGINWTPARPVDIRP